MKLRTAMLLSVVLIPSGCGAQHSPGVAEKGSEAEPSQGHECILIEDVQIASAPPPGLDEFASKLWAANGGHSLEKGSRSVLAIRIFSEQTGIADSQHFTKLTSYVDTADIVPALNDELTGGYFSSGSSGFAYKGDVWKAQDISFHVRPLPNRADAIDVAATIDAVNTYRESRKTFDLHFQCDVNRLKLADLSPWQGGGGNPWSFFYPQKRP